MPSKGSTIIIISSPSYTRHRNKFSMPNDSLLSLSQNAFQVLRCIGISLVGRWQVADFENNYVDFLGAFVRVHWLKSYKLPYVQRDFLLCATFTYRNDLGTPPVQVCEAIAFSFFLLRTHTHSHCVPPAHICAVIKFIRSFVCSYEWLHIRKHTFDWLNFIYK